MSKTTYRNKVEYFKKYKPGTMFVNSSHDVFVLVDDRDKYWDSLINIYTGKIMHWSRWNMKGIKAVYPHEVRW